jgi:intracellular multiplication protein IcmE
MATESDAGRDTKLIIGLVSGVTVAIVCGGYFLWSWVGTPPAQPSVVNLDRVAGSATTKSSETPAYRALLDQSNREGAVQAQRKNSTFISSMKFELEPVAPNQSQAPTARSTPGANEARSADRANSGSSTDTAQQDQRRLEALDKFLTKLNPEMKTALPTGLQTARILGSSGSEGGLGGNGSVDNSYQQWSQGLNGGMRNVSSSSGGANRNSSISSAPIVPVEVIPPYWRGPGIIDIGVDSDNSTTPVLGKIGTGIYAGAELKAPDGAKLTGDGVVIHFTEMAFKGINYKIDAYALQEDTLLANVATEVNNRYMSRIVLPAVLSGIGGIGQMYSQANTQLVSNGFNSEVVRPGLPDGTAVLGAVAGGAAGQASKVLSEDAARVPAKQVKVTKGQVVAIQFMRGVYSADAIAPGQGGDAVKAAIPVQALNTTAVQPVTAEQWRAAARLQIQSQQMRELNP